MTSALHSRFAASCSLLGEVADLIAERAETTTPGWADARGWTDYLVALADQTVAAVELDGAARHFAADPACPDSLRRLAQRVLQTTTLAPVGEGLVAGPAAGGPEPRRASLRKRSQVEAVVRSLAGRFAGVQRVVDVGAGHGHLTTRAARTLGAPGIGLDWSAERVAVARALAGEAPVEFLDVDALAGDGEEVVAARLAGVQRPLLVALHGCGALGDALVRVAAKAGAEALLVACCPQKIRGDVRLPLCPDGGGAPGGAPGLERERLGLANVLARPAGVERPLAEELAVRETKLALRLLLQGRGLTLHGGDEMRGINRRRAHAGLAALVAAALVQRGLQPASADELQTAGARAAELYPRLRRLELPRSMLGRVLEVHLAEDRGLFLERAGLRVEVGELFPTEVSPRNVVVIARRPAG